MPPFHLRQHDIYSNSKKVVKTMLIKHLLQDTVGLALHNFNVWPHHFHD